MIHLLHDAWIPVVRKNGDSGLIAPHQITSDYDTNPVIELNASRPDFNGALIQFLIGLIQTVCPPESDKEWTDRLDNVIPSDVLKGHFKQIQDAFSLDGKGPRFMQDISIGDEKKNSVDGLLIEMPGENTVKKNTDFFVKRDTVKQMCPSCAAMALFTLQVNGPGGGAGHKTGLRGGGPLTSVILGETLWETVWLNIIPSIKFFGDAIAKQKKSMDMIFPWFGKIRLSDKKEKTGVIDVNPLQMFWGMGRRILLDFEDKPVGACDVCGLASSATVLTYHTKPHGVDYDETWDNHTLTPYYLDKEVYRPIHLQPGGITYRNFMGLIIPDSSRNIKVSRTVTNFQNNIIRLKRKSFKKVRLWSFGYDMDNAKARCWYESRMPIYLLDDEKKRELFENIVSNLIFTAEYVLQSLAGSIKDAISGHGNKGKEPVDLRSRFWNETEELFYATLDRLFFSLGNVEQIDQIKREWYRMLVGHSVLLFDYYTQVSLISDLNDPKSVIDARIKFKKFTGENTKKVISLLGLLMKDSMEEKKL
ncbi:CRISPR-associated protein, Cse1 family [Methanospirillum hungatei JF-1]|uniref:CRISPR-associated protein, Cse1 family n=1 Tax=Methanospirillum hungatei JF-1 (strain ATCC 27890 / DSM 864 / NBRC 100397 / JF-1) TaxID=323259 RepID=Q2FNL5_METHJ|nr:type I-E CRISPR-associated protein Cse1/CasA [Methanospirillum hungatei]ABD41120.1 CRISPR-associated protein, Cse1 family [Methanospirillum hungatei JF-1]